MEHLTLPTCTFAWVGYRTIPTIRIEKSMPSQARPKVCSTIHSTTGQTVTFPQSSIHLSPVDSCQLMEHQVILKTILCHNLQWALHRLFFLIKCQYSQLCQKQKIQARGMSTSAPLAEMKPTINAYPLHHASTQNNGLSYTQICKQQPFWVNGLLGLVFFVALPWVWPWCGLMDPGLITTSGD